jgi:hypothetical protein
MGIQFEEDQIIFVEIKPARTDLKLNSMQNTKACGAR